MKKFYANIALAGLIAALAALGCANPTGDDPVYGISLDQNGPHTFPDTLAGYGAQTAKTVTITNTGNRGTGNLTIGKSGTNAADFTVSSTSLPGIAAGGTGSFTVAPVTGLAKGTYTATIAVSGGNGINAAFDVSFTVKPAGEPMYSIEASETGTYTFPGAAAGYGAQGPRTVTVNNTGNQTTGALTIANTNTASFTVSKTAITDIAIGAADTFTVAPVTGLPAGTYTATITVSGGNSISESFTVSFTVNPADDTPVYSIGLSEAGTLVFPAVYAGYGAQTAKTVTVANTGNQPAGTLTIATSGTNASGFTVSKTAITDIAIGAADTFTVAPATGLPAGTYAATITVSGGNGINAAFDVSFTVKPAGDTPVYSIEASETGTYTFPGAAAGYGAQGPRTVTVNNTGNQTTGALTIANTDTASFTVSKTAITDIAIGVADTFTVAPVTGLAVGTYTATITVSGGNSISESFSVSFTVTAVPVYAIALDLTGTHTFPGVFTGYGAQTAKTVTVANTGNQPAGTLSIGKSGANTASFTVSPTSLPGVAVGGTDSFTVAPVTGLPAGTYTATITVSGGNGINAAFDVSFTVDDLILHVTFNAAGGTPATSTAQTSYGGTVSLPANPVRSGYTFSGWHTAANGGGTAFTAATTVTEDITVYAKWLSSNATLAGLSLNSGWLALDTAFSPYTLLYSATVPYTTTSVTVSATEGDFGKASLAFPDGDTVTLNPGANTIRVRVTAEDGTTTRTYTISVTRTPLSANANLGSLTVSAGALSPAFSAATTAYTALVPSGTSSITVTAAVEDTGKATLMVLPSYTVSLVSDSTLITLTVTAEDGTTTKAYAVTVKKTTETNAVNVAITVADERIDLTRSTGNDLSREAGNALRLTAPAGYTNYVWRVDDYDGYYNLISEREIELYAGNYSYGTHSVLLEYEKDGVPYGCEVVVRVVR